MARILPKRTHGWSTDEISTTRVDWHGTWMSAPSNPNYTTSYSSEVKRQKLSISTPYQPPAIVISPASGAKSVDSPTPEKIFEARARFLESLLLALKYSTPDPINRFLFLIRDPQLQVTSLSQAFDQLFENCQGEEIAETIQACRCAMASLTLEDMVSLSSCLTLTDDSGCSVKSSPGTRSTSAALSFVPGEFDTNSPYSATNMDHARANSRQLSMINGYTWTTNDDSPNIREKPMTYPLDTRQKQSLLSSQSESKPELWHDKLLPQPSRMTAVLGHFQLDRLDNRVYDIPLSDSQSDFSTYCLDLRNSGRRALARGISLNRLTYWGKLDCELLFRDRISEDDWNIPNWACEVARRLPHMTPATRMAFAATFTKVMSYLISPSIDTWQQLPVALRPTKSQMRVTHDISVSFAPFPKLRDSLVENPTEWLLVWLKHNCGMNWAGVYGDVGPVELTEVGNWKTSTLTKPTRPTVNTGIETLKAVEYDHKTGRRYISHEFQTWCWDCRNWYISQDVLKVWPDLSGEIPIL